VTKSYEIKIWKDVFHFVREDHRVYFTFSQAGNPLILILNLTVLLQLFWETYSIDYVLSVGI
jgi:hypothetical protein